MKGWRLALVLLATVAVYAPLRSAQWVYEDRPTVTFADPWQGTVGELARAVHWPKVWDPEIGLTDATFRMEQRLGYTGHLSAVVINLSLFLVCGLLIARLASRLGLPGWLAAGLFLLHPMQVEAVAYVSKRGELLAALGLLGACLAALSHGSRWWRGPVIGLLVGLTWHTKAPAVVIAGLVPFVWAWDRGVRPRPRLLWLAAGLLVPFLLVNAPLPLMRDSLLGRSVWAFLGGQAVTLWHLAQLIVLPWGFTVDYDAAVAPAGAQAVALVTLAILLGWAVVRGIAGSRSWAVWAVLWTGIAVAPRFVFPSTEWLNEHQMLTPMIGVSLALTAGLVRLEAVWHRGWSEWRSGWASGSRTPRDGGRPAASSSSS